ncbi:MAG: glucan 1,4-alpha-glucosidase [Rhodothermales bacterium]
MPTTTAFGHPGIQPRWTVSAKSGVGTAYAASSRVWFTLSLGILSEIYYPTLDRPQTRDLQYLIADGKQRFDEEKRDLKHHVELIDRDTLGYRITSEAKDGRYRIVKEIISEPHQPAVLINTKLEGDWDGLSLYALMAPHLNVGGYHNNAEVCEMHGQTILLAHREDTWMAVAATIPFTKASVGYVGESDGWTDLNDNRQMDWTFDRATDGNLAMTGELDLAELGDDRMFTLGVAFGDTEHSALTTLMQALDVPFEDQKARFIRQWHRACRSLENLDGVTHDNGELYHVSQSLLLSHEDKTYQGATIASMSIPWGEARSDDDIGGYHLVWTRDMFNTVTGLMAAGNTETARRALVYLACAQNEDGGFHQNFWIDGSPYWTGEQLDGVAFPIMLAWRLHDADLLRRFDPYPMVMKAARYLIANGPITQQERWEENSGYSPSTLASMIAALTCAAAFARERGNDDKADFIQDYADFLEAHVEAWTVTTEGTLVEGITEHYIRVTPSPDDGKDPQEDPNSGTVTIANREPGSQVHFPAKEVADAGFLELVRYGIRAPGTKLIEDSLKVVDAYLKVDFPQGPCWVRYNHDGYGQRPNGGPYHDAGHHHWGLGHAWPLLTGERAHYELAAGRNVDDLIQALEGFATDTSLLPEQIWMLDDLPNKHMRFGEPTGAAMPLMWAHAEYIKLLRSVRDGAIFDRLAVVADRYLDEGYERPSLEVWALNRRIKTIPAGTETLRIIAERPFRLHWGTVQKPDQTTAAAATGLGIHYVDLSRSDFEGDTLRFAYGWTEKGEQTKVFMVTWPAA